MHGSDWNNLQISPSYQMENSGEKPAGQTNQRRGRLVFVSWLLQIQTNQESRPRPEFQFRGFAEAVNVIFLVSISSIDSRLYGTHTWLWELGMAVELETGKVNSQLLLLHSIAPHSPNHSLTDTVPAPTSATHREEHPPAEAPAPHPSLVLGRLQQQAHGF